PTPTPKPKYTSPAKANTLGEAIAMEAQRYLGVKYVWAKADPKIGFDCSGLTWYVFNRYGIDTPRGTATYKNAGTIVPYSQIAPGDVISWDVWKDGSSIDHVGIYIGNGKMVHASSNRRNRAVVVANVKEYTNSARIVQIHRFYKN
ncbi:NlpC/P60 family protein, partial [Candidatus Nomurabacteria bacterium]|nr:NlpC/P60 family protein [Candidatus Nomurabacteria bacterium]